MSDDIRQTAFALWHDGTAIVAIAALLFSLASLFVKLIMQTERQLSIIIIVLIFSLMGLLTTFSIIVFTSGQEHDGRQSLLALPPSAQRLCVLRGLLGAATVLLFYSSIQVLLLRDAVTLFFTSPLLALLLEWLIVPGGKPSLVAAGGCFAAVLGVAFISRGGGRLTQKTRYKAKLVCDHSLAPSSILMMILPQPRHRPRHGCRSIQRRSICGRPAIAATGRAERATVCAHPVLVPPRQHHMRRVIIFGHHLPFRTVCSGFESAEQRLAISLSHLLGTGFRTSSSE